MDEPEVKALIEYYQKQYERVVKIAQQEQQANFDFVEIAMSTQFKNGPSCEDAIDLIIEKFSNQ